MLELGNFRMKAKISALMVTIIMVARTKSKMALLELHSDIQWNSTKMMMAHTQYIIDDIRYGLSLCVLSVAENLVSVTCFVQVPFSLLVVLMLVTLRCSVIMVGHLDKK